MERFLNFRACLGCRVAMLRRTQQYIICDVQHICYLQGLVWVTSQRAVAQLAILPEHQIFADVLTNLVHQICACAFTHWPAQLILAVRPRQSLTTMCCKLVTSMLNNVRFVPARANIVAVFSLFRLSDRPFFWSWGRRIRRERRIRAGGG